MALNEKADAILSLCSNIPDLNSKFDFLHKLGQGSFSTVVLARLKDCPTHEIALKCLIPTTKPSRAVTELKILRELGGRENVINLLCTFRQEDRIFFIMDYFPHDLFSSFVYDATIEEIRDYMKNLLIALRHIHQFNVIHRDIKATNFLFNRQLRKYRLIDFGLADFQVDSLDSNLAGSVTNTKCKRKLNRSDEENETSPKQKKQTLKLRSPTGFGTTKTQTNKKLNDDSLRHNEANQLFDCNSPKKGQSPQNVLTAKSKLKLTCPCFGRLLLCKLCKGRRQQKVNKAGTAGFRAPEVLLNHPNQTVAIDVWACGIIFLGLLSRRYPFMRPKDDSEALAQQITLFGSEAVTNLAQKLKKKLLSRPVRPALCLSAICELLRSDKDRLSAFASTDLCKICCRSTVVFGCYICLCTSPQSKEVGNFFPDDVYDLLGKILTVDSLDRITASDALSHQFFTK